jgi:DNA helicase-2/ATP-dependent DNA helicase PcrA
LEDIPVEMVDETQPGRARREGRAGVGISKRPERWQVPERGSAPVVQPRFQPGARVEHNVWGEGMVLNSRIQDDDEIVDIFFENVGLKRVAASLAKLQVKS